MIFFDYRIITRIDCVRFLYIALTSSRILYKLFKHELIIKCHIRKILTKLLDIECFNEFKRSKLLNKIRSPSMPECFFIAHSYFIEFHCDDIEKMIVNFATYTFFVPPLKVELDFYYNILIINNKQKCKNKNVFYGVNAHENNHLLNEIKSSNQCIQITNVSKLNSENEAIKKLIIGGETDSSFFSPGTKRKAERTYSSTSDSKAIETISILIFNHNKPFTNRLRSEIMKRFLNDKGQTLGFYEKKFHNEMEEIKKDLLKLVPKNSNFKELWKKAGDSFKND
ncbi:hypothetical protein BpHYR1_008465 [Brachionus plicatilis]|uniref:Uncharacterized protein n=1 Tax=Brachionus plicatilis TaxID=10195 RepID=A0A3M7SA10_BRAPC|nr:hypothetical protein BpHYR1_008465 [Brachionus plicatilis]